MISLNTHPVFKSVNPFKKRGHIARFFLAGKYAKLFPRSTFIGVTGSVGKTLTVIACKTVLSEKMKVIATTDTDPKVANLDPIYNLPKTILRTKRDTKKVILEMGIEYPGEMDLYLSMVRPDTAIVTKIAYAHSQFLGGVDDIAREKGKLVEQLSEKGTAILNWDDSQTRKLADKTKAEVVYYGTDSKNCHVWAGDLKIRNFQTNFQLNYGVERVEVPTQLLGFHQIYPLLAAASLGISLGIPLINIKKALEKVSPAPHRMEVFPGHNNSVIIDDTYNSSPSAVEEAIDTLNQVPARRRIVVLGEMRELGDFSEKMHREIARKIYKEKIDLVLTGTGDAEIIGDELIKLGFIPERLSSGLSNPQLVAELLKIIAKGDVCLVKASKDVKFNEVVERIIKKK